MLIASIPASTIDSIYQDWLLHIFRIAKLFTHPEVEAIQDKKDKFKR